MRRNLKRGMAGPEVRELQGTLNTFGYRIELTSFFGRHTDEAVRNFQTRRGLISDGIVGWRTRKALGLDRKPLHPTGLPPHPVGSSNHPAGHPSNPAGPLIDAAGAVSSFYHNVSDLAHRVGCNVSDLIDSARKARSKSRPAPRPAPPKAPAQAPVQLPTPAPAQAPGEDILQNVKGMHMSTKGKQFIYTHEAQKNVSNHLHWPRGASGVTLGPGYDMKKLSESEVKANMMAIGLDPATAEKVSKGVKLTEDNASQFADDNYSLVNLTEKQEMKLLDLIVPKYEKDVKNWIRVPLKQYQFDALVSFAYNPGYDFGAVMKLINKGQVQIAMSEIKKRVKSKGKVMKSLVDRRNYEVKLYLTGDYGKLRKVKSS